MILALMALIVGVIGGLRAFTAPAAVSWAAYLGWLPVGNTVLSFMGSVWVVAIATVLALGEFVTDQLPSTPSRKVPLLFGARIVLGALSGATIGAAFGGIVVGGVAGIVGAVIGTLGGAAVRARLAAAFARDTPAAFIEDAVALAAAVLLVVAIR